ncbi:MAG: hypothetical protein QGH61_10780 [Candidatus Marinimicrobia bacterium]|jgi:hypothetical protein|nr:hypothetical protein [Candidatus Neomarinimicrobiota bacterium]
MKSDKSLFFCAKYKLSKPFTAVLVDILLQFYYRFSKRATVDGKCIASDLPWFIL